MYLFYLPGGYPYWSNITCCALFSLASLTDWLDGFLARRWSVTSNFGAFLDPVADKLMVSTVLILLVGRYGALFALPTSVILAREIAVSALREWMSGQGKRNVVKVSWAGKCKTVFQMIAIIGILLVPFPMDKMWGLSSTHVDYFFKFFIGFLYLSAGMTVTSGLSYFMAAKDDLLS